MLKIYQTFLTIKTNSKKKGRGKIFFDLLPENESKQILLLNLI